MLSNGTVRSVGIYDLLEEIGRGQFSTVYLARLQTDKTVFFAAKVIKKKLIEKNTRLKELLDNEMKIMRSVKHPNILHLHDTVETDDEIVMITEFCKDGNMETYIEKKGRLAEAESIFYLKQIMSAFVELHAQKIIHRDLKLANIYRHNGHVVIGDFGFAKMGAVTTTSKLGTPYYMAPEVLFNRGQSPYTSKCDLFSIGVVYFYMLYGRLPFPADNLKDLEKMIDRGSGQELNIPDQPFITPESKELLKGLLEKDPIERISWKQFFNHRVFTIEYINNFVPEFDSSGSSILSSRGQTINSSLLIPSQKSLVVNETFQADRKRMSLMGDDVSEVAAFRPASVHHSANNNQEDNPVQSELLFTKQSLSPQWRHILDFYHHERNKRRYCMSVAKLSRELSKIEDIPEKHRDLYSVSAYLLSLKGYRLCTQLARTILYKDNIYRLDDFEGFLGSKHSQKLLISLRKEESDSNTYYQHITGKFIAEKNAIIANSSFQVDTALNPDLELHDIDHLLQTIIIKMSSIWIESNHKVNANIAHMAKMLSFISCLEKCKDLDTCFPLKTPEGQYFNWDELRTRPLDDNPEGDSMKIVDKYSKLIPPSNAACSQLCTKLTYFCR